MFETLGRTLHPSQTLKLKCDACGHQSEWTRPWAFRKLGPAATPYEIRRRLQCSACGGRRVSIWI